MYKTYDLSHDGQGLLNWNSFPSIKWTSYFYKNGALLFVGFLLILTSYWTIAGILYRFIKTSNFHKNKGYVLHKNNHKLYYLKVVINKNNPSWYWPCLHSTTGLPWYPGGQEHCGRLPKALHCALMPQTPDSKQGLRQAPSGPQCWLGSQSSSAVHNAFTQAWLGSPWYPSGHRQTGRCSDTLHRALMPQGLSAPHGSWQCPEKQALFTGQSLATLHPLKHAPSSHTNP